eukprot:2957920-Prymnesium_polylepis.1
MPALNDVYARVMRRAGALVLDPTLALSQRPDGRRDYLHLGHDLAMLSTWRMLQSAFLLRGGG